MGFGAEGAGGAAGGGAEGAGLGELNRQFAAWVARRAAEPGPPRALGAGCRAYLAHLARLPLGAEVSPEAPPHFRRRGPAPGTSVGRSLLFCSPPFSFSPPRPAPPSLGGCGSGLAALPSFGTAEVFGHAFS